MSGRLAAWQRLSGCLAVVCGALVAGCRPRHPELTPVSGRVTYGGGDWPAVGELYFATIAGEAGVPRRPGRAAFGTDGRFKASTFRPGDGLYPGEYRVNIECWKSPPSAYTRSPGESYVPELAPEDLPRIIVPQNSPGCEVQIDFPLLSRNRSS